MSTLATMMGQAKDLEDALKGLADAVPVGIVGRKPLNVDTDVAETAPPGRYNVEVKSLAQAAQGATQSFATADTRVAAGQYKFVVDGKNFEFTLLPDATVDDLAGALAAVGAPVQTSLVNTGSGVTLSITGTNTGLSTGVAAGDALRLELVTPDPADATLTPPPTVPSITINQPAANAVVKVNGIEISRASNTIDGVIPGVTLKATNVGTV
jgi:flagellar hook-associated protein 2